MHITLAPFTALALLMLLASCTREPNTSNIKIVGGSTVSSPYLFYANPAPLKGGEIFCGASRIARNVVVTAAHCVEDWSSRRIGVVFGKTSIKETDRAEKIPVRQLVIHPDFNSITLKNDIALLILDEHPLLDASDDYAQLPRNNGQPEVGDLLKTIGFGAQSSYSDIKGKERDSLQEAEVPVLSNSFCESLYNQKVTAEGFGEQLQTKINNSQICAGYPEQGMVDSCTGDSGGPLFRKSSEGKGGYELIGIVSTGFPFANCAEKKTAGIYTRVSAYTRWIDETVEILKNRRQEIPRHQLIAYECYDLPIPTSTQDQIRASYRMSTAEPYKISKAEYTKLAQLEVFGSCDQLRDDGLSTRFVREGDTFWALISNDEDLWYKQPYEVWNYEYFGRDLAFTYSPISLYMEISLNNLKFWGLGETKTTPPSAHEITKLDLAPLSISVWQAADKRYYARMKTPAYGERYFALISEPAREGGILEATFSQKTGTLTIGNVTKQHIVSWQISCPFAFEVTDAVGRLFTSEQYQSSFGPVAHLVTFRHPRDKIGVIPEGGKVVLTMNSSTSHEQFGKCSAFDDEHKIVVGD